MTAARASALRIETPEGVVFSLRLASPVLRALAWGVDALVLAAAATVIKQGAHVFAMLGTDWASALTVVLYFAASLAYAMIFEWYWRGQTLGKRLLGLRVVDAQGLRLRPAQVVLRNLLRAIDFLPASLSGRSDCVPRQPQVSAPGRPGSQHGGRARSEARGTRRGADRAGEVQFARGISALGGAPAQPRAIRKRCASR